MTGPSSPTPRTTARVTAAVVAVLVVLVGLLAVRWLAGRDDAEPAGEGSSPATAAEAGSTPTGTTAVEPTSPDTASAGPTPASLLTALPDGEHFGFVAVFDGASLTVDPADVFLGEDAVAAARRDGEIGPDEDLPNPFYLRNPDAEQVRLAVAPGFEATLLDNREVRPRTVDAATLAGLFAGEADDSWVYSWFDGPVQQLPMLLTVAGGEVVRADQQYLP